MTFIMQHLGKIVCTLFVLLINSTQGLFFRFHIYVSCFNSVGTRTNGMNILFFQLDCSIPVRHLQDFSGQCFSYLCSYVF